MDTLRRLLDRLARAFFRPLAFFSKEFTQLRRQPRLILMLVLGPFAVLLLFGLGYTSESQPIRTILVVPDDGRMPVDRAVYEDEFMPPFELAEVTVDRSWAIEMLRREYVDAVVLFPEDAAETIQNGEQATIELVYNELDPLKRSWLAYYAYVQTTELNRRVLLYILQEQDGHLTTPAAGIGMLGMFAGGERIPPHVLVSPFAPAGRNIAPVEPDYVSFYAPGVLALLIQHIAVTFTALTLVRERLRGAIELFRIAPVTSREILAGKYLSYFIQTAVVTALLVGLMVYALDIPMLGDRLLMAGVIALLIAASLGVGFFISAISRSETQAVQFSLLLLLASVFFSGFFLPLENLLRPVWAVSYSLPVTYGNIGLQDLMLRGQSPPQWVFGVLSVMAAGLLVLSALLFQRDFRRR